MHPSFLTVPPLHAACRISVTIPARDEAALIERALEAFAAQRAIDGSPLPENLFEIVVFANACRDDTVRRARRAARRHRHVPIHVVDAGRLGGESNVGTARKLAMDFAAARLTEGPERAGIVASADADTIVDPEWIAWLERESRDADAVAGHVSICEKELALLHAPVRVLYAREITYRRLVAEVEALIDPRPEDPAPRHSSFVGASFGVGARVYLAAGGVPPLAKLEDLAFAGALARIDARVRHSVRMRATTSGRVRPRVEGGFGSFMADLAERGRRRDTFYTEAAEYWIDRFSTRAALRRIWNDAETCDDGDIVSRTFGLGSDVWRGLIDPSAPFGLVLDRVEQQATHTRRRYALVPVEDAIAILRDAAASRNAAMPIRTSAASGAG